MNKRSLQRVCTLLLALILVIMPISGIKHPVQALEFITDPDVPMPWGVRWTGDYTVEWQKPYDYHGSQELFYNVKLVMYSSTSTSSKVNSVEHVGVKGYQFTIPKENFTNGKYYYQVQVTTVKPSDSRYCSPMAYTELVRGTELVDGHISPWTEYLDGTIELRVNQKYTGGNRQYLDIDREDYIRPGQSIPAYEQVSVFGDLPKGLDWGYGEADTPYIYGTPTEIGLYSVEFLVHLQNGQNLLIYQRIKVLPESMYSSEMKIVEKGKRITPFVPTFSYSGVSGAWIRDGALPPGLQLNQTTSPARISGTPTKAGRYSVTLGGYDQWQNEYEDLLIILVTESAGQFAEDWILQQNKDYRFVLPPHIDGAFQDADLISGSLPAGMTWWCNEGDGVVISGKPTESGYFYPVFKIINVKGKYSQVTMNITVTGSGKAVDLYEVDLTGTGGQLTMTNAEYTKVLKGTLEAAVKGQQIQRSEVKVEALNITAEAYDFDNDNKSDLLVTPSGKNYIISQVLKNTKDDDFFLDLNEASIYAAKMGSSDYAETVAFRVKKPAPLNPFTDVAAGTYCYDPVLWAYYYKPQITNGLSSSEFGPDAKCTRAQIVTFLWRAAGCPEPSKTTTDFKDVDLSSDSWYGKAVLWAVEKGITSGVSKTSFDPNGNCNRAQVVTFLWRFSGQQNVTNSDCEFTDVDHSQYYIPAVLWAVKYNITKGTGDTTFGPNETCTRGQIVTFLYRLLYSYNVVEKNDLVMYCASMGTDENGTFIEGGIRHGSVRFGSRIRVISYDSKTKESTEQILVVKKILAYNKEVRSASAEDYVKLTVWKESGSIKLTQGDAVVGVNSGIRPVRTNVWGTVTINAASDPKNVLKEGTIQKVTVGYHNAMATAAAVKGGILKNGQSAENVLWNDFDYPVVFYVGQEEVYLGDNDWLYGTMKVTKVGP